MATFEKRASGWWQAKIRRKGWPAQSKTFEKRADAEAWARSIENEMDRGVFVSREEAEQTSLYKALERYLKEVTPLKKGRDMETYRVKAWQARPLSKKSLASIRSADIAAFRDQRQAEGIAASTIAKELALISHLYEVARKDWGIEVDNPVKKVRKPKVDNARERIFVGDEERYLMEALDEPTAAVRTKEKDRRNIWTPILVRIAIETAMRQGELLALQWQHVDLEKRTVHLLDTKNGTSRTVPLSSQAVNFLKAQESGNVKQIRRGKVFPTTASALKQSFSRAVARGRRNYQKDCQKACVAPIPEFLVDLHFHDLRHIATTRLADKLELHELMKVTGHKDTRMLARYYHPKAEDLAQKIG